MADEPVKAETPKEPEAPLTSAELKAALDRLATDVRAAGASLATTYLKQGMGILDSLLAALEEGKEKEAKKK